MKDRHAVTRQWMSLPPPVDARARATRSRLRGRRVLEARATRTSCAPATCARTGSCCACAASAPDVAAARARAILDAARGAAGRAELVRRAAVRPRRRQRRARARASCAATAGRRATASSRRLLVSALQSRAVQPLARRADRRRPVRAACSPATSCTSDGGGMFACDDPAVDEPRLAAGELVVTGPMFGDRMRAPADGSAGRARARPRCSPPPGSPRVVRRRARDRRGHAPRRRDRGRRRRACAAVDPTRSRSLHACPAARTRRR